MSRLFVALAASAAILVPVACASAAPTADRSDRRAIGAPDSSGRSLSAAEVQQLYSGRTWRWSDGGAYFDPSGRFQGVVVRSSANSAFMARGNWKAGADGTMCFQALWKGRIGNNNSHTCFSHKLQGGKILQKKGDAGTWYTFKNAPARKSDEFSKLVPGNRIADKLTDVHTKYLSRIPM